MNKVSAPILKLERRSKTYSAFYQVASASTPGSYYVVAHRVSPDRWECGCPAWTRHTPRADCKHITQVRQALNVRPVPQAAAGDPLPVSVARALSRFSALDVD